MKQELHLDSQPVCGARQPAQHDRPDHQSIDALSEEKLVVIPWTVGQSNATENREPGGRCMQESTADSSFDVNSATNLELLLSE